MTRRLHVLLVEDDQQQATATQECLRLIGHTVTWVETVTQAFDGLHSAHSIEIVLLDLSVGDERGEAIFEKLQLLEIKHPPVLIFSGDTAAVIALAAERVKTVHTLRKPASLQQMDHALQMAAD